MLLRQQPGGCRVELRLLGQAKRRCAYPPPLSASTHPEDTQVSFQVSGLVTGRRTLFLNWWLPYLPSSTALPKGTALHHTAFRSSLIFTAESGLRGKTASQCRRKGLS